MKLKPTGPNGQFLASGVVEGLIVLPKGMDIGLNVSRLLPDVLIFDGEVNSTDALASYSSGSMDRELNRDGDSKEFKWKWWKSKHPPPRDPLPDPLPDRAFGHIRPEEWLDAKSVRVDLDEDGDDFSKKVERKKGEKEKETGAVYAVSAKVVDVPLEVLPGRQKEFSNFVSKVRIFSYSFLLSHPARAHDRYYDIQVIWNPDGALAGIQGTAAVGLTVDGLPGQSTGSPAHPTSNYLVLAGLPFEGSVRINKKSLFEGEMKGLRKIVEEFPFIQR